MLTQVRAWRAATPNQRRDIEEQIIKGGDALCRYVIRRYLAGGSKLKGARLYRTVGRIRAGQRPLELSDLMQEARMALLDAVRRFDDSRSTYFAQYAITSIERRIEQAIDTDRQMKSDVAWEMPATRSLTRSRDDADGMEAEDSPQSLEEIIADAGAARPDAFIDDHAETVAALLTTLADRDAQVVRLRFGLDGCQPHELAEIGAVLGITKQRVHVILKRALAALRSQLQEAA